MLNKQITSRFRVILEKLIIVHALKKFPEFYGIRRFITISLENTTGLRTQPAEASP
jgi:hypothetical protein